MKSRLAILAALITGIMMPSCGSGSKNEWGILQQVESECRNSKFEPLIFESVSGYDIVGIAVGSERVWILLNPRHSPFYKQMPNKVNYTITEDQLEKIEERGVSETVSECLKSHICY